ncbi:00068520-42de-497d-b56f-4948f0319dd6 [Sclerotinia trifoliorum]|uniref:00068520-42de-497d-b56f-4948f0319dd6 n=1 Tax=Sclerotinia trifoliorum TaxID=28548 RepID=A0A8H2VV52_9HELO|nr:00068520-42de-497d-b56f-4948f0319dd6 [Sclerotinia trifoliorum]
MSEPHNYKHSYNTRSDSAYGQGNANPKPSGGTAYGSPNMTQNSRIISRPIDEIITSYVSIAQSIIYHRGIFDDAFIITIQKQLEEAKSRLDSAYAFDRCENSSPTLHAVLKRQRLVIKADKYFEVVGITSRIMGMSFKLRDLDAQIKKLIERGHYWNAEKVLLMKGMTDAKMEILELQTRLRLLEL